MPPKSKAPKKHSTEWWKLRAQQLVDERRAKALANPPPVEDRPPGALENLMTAFGVTIHNGELIHAVGPRAGKPFNANHPFIKL